MKDLEKYFYASQIKWIEDESPLKIAVKSRQIGFSFANALRLVLQVSARDARLDAYISTRDLLRCLRLLLSNPCASAGCPAVLPQNLNSLPQTLSDRRPRS